MSANRRLLVMLPVLAIAAWLALFGDKTPEEGLSGPTRGSQDDSASSEDAPASIEEAEDPSGLLRVVGRKDLAERAAQDSGVDLFSNRAADAPPEGEQPEENPEEQVPQFPYSYIGKQYDGKRWQVFLDKDDATLVVSVGAKIEGDFRVKAINPPQMQVVHVPTKHELSIHIDDAQ